MKKNLNGANRQTKGPATGINHSERLLPAGISIISTLVLAASFFIILSAGRQAFPNPFAPQIPVSADIGTLIVPSPSEEAADPAPAGIISGTTAPAVRQLLDEAANGKARSISVRSISAGNVVKGILAASRSALDSHSLAEPAGVSEPHPGAGAEEAGQTQTGGGGGEAVHGGGGETGHGGGEATHGGGETGYGDGETSQVRSKTDHSSGETGDDGTGRGGGEATHGGEGGTGRGGSKTGYGGGETSHGKKVSEGRETD